MKVDKAVCTNDTFEDLSRAIKFEELFSTLVENKILAIKRECEQQQQQQEQQQSKKKTKKKGRRSLGKILFGNKIFGDKNNGDDTNHDGAIKDGGIGSGGGDDGGGAVAADLERGNLNDGDKLKCMSSPSNSSTTLRDKIVVEIEDEIASDVILSEIDLKEKSTRSDYGRPDVHAIRSQDDTVSGCCMVSRCSLNDKHTAVGTKRTDETGSNSLPSEGENLPSTESGSGKKVRLSKHVSIDRGCPKETSLYLENERTRLRILEAKSISAQCSPIFPRQKLGQLGRPYISSFDETSLSTACRDRDTKHIQSQPHPPPPLPPHHSTTTAATTTTSETSDIISALNDKENVGRDRDRDHDKEKRVSGCKSKSSGKKQTSKKIALEYDSIISYQGNSSASQGFISSFNQLTSNFPVIATTKSKNPYCDTIKLQRITSGGGTTGSASSAMARNDEKSGAKRKDSKLVDSSRNKGRFDADNLNEESEEEFKRRKRKYSKGF